MFGSTVGASWAIRRIVADLYNMPVRRCLHFRYPPHSVLIVYTGKAHDIECSKLGGGNMIKKL